jgi:hypothetical protein
MISTNLAPATRRTRWMLAMPILALLVAAAWPTTAAAKEVVTGNMECQNDSDAEPNTAMVTMAGTFKLAAVSAQTGVPFRFHKNPDPPPPLLLGPLTEEDCDDIVDDFAALVAQNRECAVGSRFRGDDATHVGFACAGPKGKMIRIMKEILNDVLTPFDVLTPL